MEFYISTSNYKGFKTKKVKKHLTMNCLPMNVPLTLQNNVIIKLDC
jgi:hypothetical protein